MCSGASVFPQIYIPTNNNIIYVTNITVKVHHDIIFSRHVHCYVIVKIRSKTKIPQRLTNFGNHKKILMENFGMMNFKEKIT